MVQGYRRLVQEELANAQAYNTILVNSYFSRESVLRAYGLDSKVCYLGIDADLFCHQNLERNKTVIGLGSITPAKNIRFVIEALSYIEADQRPTLIWVGNMAFDYHMTALKRYAASVNVVFEPQVGISDNELVALLNRSAMMVYAPRLEPFGLAPLEGNACGLPVVAVAEGGVRESIVEGDNGLLVEADPRSMAQAITRLINDPAYARTLGEQGVAAIKTKWSVNKAIDRLETRLLETVAAFGSKKQLGLSV
jgi:glycosyltransferase involved in cell wall biosynthesis